MKSYHVGIAAEAAAAAVFARCECDVLVQCGANQPEYDLAVARGGKLLKISVKGSQDGSWGLTQSLLAKADYHGAIEAWLQKHGAKTIFCFVQFKGTAVVEMPRLYLASAAEVARRLRETARGRGDTILYERKTWSPRAAAAGTVDEIPASWRLTPERVDELFAAV